ncbi:SRPBCC family protein [Flavobacterium macacae]|uniref:Polyketide cyclase n=1 Tax=Flavobacterium macacae TaxID=2488993 RepID=A0A3P3W5P4_9FLAO|nr:SRPBCC family protein [Flavobacterium macacae]RRJ90432.1 polyketide cyclase [Flavobacterium macacae]
MENLKEKITVKTTVNKPINEVWKSWTLPKNIVNWTFASIDWHSPEAENDLKIGGKFRTRMEAKDGSMGFDFEGKYTNVELHKIIEYVLEDGREVLISFEDLNENTLITETFDPETVNSLEMQKDGWQAILNNFKKYTESL